MKKIFNKTCVSLGVFVIMTQLLACSPSPSDSQAQAQKSDTSAMSTAERQPAKSVDNAVDITDKLTKSTLRADIIALDHALKKSGMKPDDGVKWQARLAQASSEQEVKSILNEQIRTLTKAGDELEKVQLRSPEVIVLKERLIDGHDTMLKALHKLVAMDFSDPNLEQKVAPINQEVIASGQLIFGAKDEFMAMAQSLGFHTNEEHQKYYEHYKEQFDQLKSNEQ